LAEIKCGPSRFKINGLSPDEFPPLPDLTDANEYKLDQVALRDGLKKTGYAISTDETRYVLNGIFHSFKDAKLTLVATDGRRLAMVDFDVEFPASQEVDFILPTKAVQELQRLLGDQGDVRVRVSQNQVMYEVGKSLLFSKLVDGTYPNFRQVIPGPAKHRVTLDREPFLKAVQRISILAQDKSSSIKVAFSPDNIDLLASSSDVGEAHESIPVKYNGKSMVMAFNPEYLQAPLRNLATDEVHLDLIDEMNPGVIRINEPFLYVIMPMRVNPQG
jgi:DNA polymerase III subunit beta